MVELANPPEDCALCQVAIIQPDEQIDSTHCTARLWGLCRGCAGVLQGKSGGRLTRKKGKRKRSHSFDGTKMVYWLFCGALP